MSCSLQQSFAAKASATAGCRPLSVSCRMVPSVWRIAARRPQQLAHMAGSQRSCSRLHQCCRAAGGDGGGEGSQQQDGSSSSSGGGSSGGDGPRRSPPAQPSASVAKGQQTAIITGAISIAFGVREREGCIQGLASSTDSLASRRLRWLRSLLLSRGRRLFCFHSPPAGHLLGPGVLPRPPWRRVAAAARRSV